MKILFQFILKIWAGPIPFQTTGDVWSFAEEIEPFFFALRLHKIKWGVPKSIQDRLDYLEKISYVHSFKSLNSISENYENPPEVRLAQIQNYLLPIALFFSYCKFSPNITFLEEGLDNIISYFLGRHLQANIPVPSTNLNLPEPLNIPYLESRWIALLEKWNEKTFH